MGSRAVVTSDELCPQCYGTEWVSIQGKQVRCTCMARKALDGLDGAKKQAARRRPPRRAVDAAR
jgi:hypothetical protein